MPHGAISRPAISRGATPRGVETPPHFSLQRADATHTPWQCVGSFFAGLHTSRVACWSFVLVSSVLLGSAHLCAQDPQYDITPPSEKFDQPDKFRQLEELLPTPNSMRAASGARGHENTEVAHGPRCDLRYPQGTVFKFCPHAVFW